MDRYIDRTLPEAPPGPVDRREVYAGLAFPCGVDRPYRRPYTVINMVSTVDGKVVIGGAGTTRLIGSDTDHYLMERIEMQADAVVFGAGLVREDDPPYPRLSEARRHWRQERGLRPDPLWCVVSARGEFMAVPRAFARREHAALFVSERITPEARRKLEPHVQVFVCGETTVDIVAMGRCLRDELGIGSMVCLGGPTLNASVLDAGAADELFLTLAPKLQGGSGMATAVEGTGYEPEALPVLELLSLYGEGGELYLRYRLPPADRLRMGDGGV